MKIGKPVFRRMGDGDPDLRELGLPDRRPPHPCRASRTRRGAHASITACREHHVDAAALSTYGLD